LYVDDMLLVGNDKEIIQDLKTQLSSKLVHQLPGVVTFAYDLRLTHTIAR